MQKDHQIQISHGSWHITGIRQETTAKSDTMGLSRFREANCYHLVMTNIAMEAMAHRNRWFTVLNTMVDLSMANC